MTEKEAAPQAPTSVTEGKATIPVPEGTTQAVFYNPVQEFNRDMSIAAINVWSKLHIESLEAKRLEKQNKKQKLDDSTEALSNPSPPQINVLEALSATGLRAIRYAKECEHVSHIVANDFDAKAAESIKSNAEFNGVLGKVLPNEGDANMVMYQSLQRHGFGEKKLRFMIVDLDPYGTAAPFLDAAVRSVESGGMLCVTCTDMAVLAGSQFEACYSKYGSMPIPNASFCHEMGLRSLLHTVATSAGRYGRAIEPLISCSIDFYVRVFVRVVTAPAKAKQVASNTSMVFSCVGCRAYHTAPLGSYEVNGNSTKFKAPALPRTGGTCEQCGSKFHMGGPVWGSRIHDTQFVEHMLQHVREGMAIGRFGTHARMMGMLSVISEELHDQPLYYSLDSICQALHCHVPPMKTFGSAIVNAGYKISSSHCLATSFKTDAPNCVIWDILRCWIKQKPIAEKRIIEGSVVSKVIAVEPTHVADFTYNKKAEPESRKIKLVRYQENPTKNWGPKPKAKPGAAFAASSNAGSKRGREDEQPEEEQKQNA
ncbi:N2,N2-dimethylguanosine tRNA methyltransferase-domain-containing protein [Chytriomyces sp. MP71]|nr:N2,N2-dimethylguanosine tRNA methyltransferase-domain-containing protein [Chytriomyces sp. MP71]